MKLLIKNGLTILPQGNKITDIFIDGDRICAIGEKPEGFAPDRVIDAVDKLVVPGFINASHAHLHDLHAQPCRRPEFYKMAV